MLRESTAAEAKALSRRVEALHDSIQSFIPKYQGSITSAQDLYRRAARFEWDSAMRTIGLESVAELKDTIRRAESEIRNLSETRDAFLLMLKVLRAETEKRR